MCYETAGLNDYQGESDDVIPKGWPWDAKWWKPRGVLRNLEKAGALYLADLDRMNRKPKDSQKELILFLEKRVEFIAEEIDKFLAPLPGDPYLQNDKNEQGERRHTFALLNEMNQEQTVKQIAVSKRPATPLYYEEHLRRKLAVSETEEDRAPSGSILNSMEICTCVSGKFCNHRLEWLMAYLNRAHSNIMVRLHESSNTIDQLTAKLEEAQDEIQQMKYDERDRDAIGNIGDDGDL